MAFPQSRLRAIPTKSRVFIVTDIANEPDDSESLVRYLLYSNEFDTCGLVACTSTHIKRRVCPEEIVNIVNAYGEVVDKLNVHVHPDNPYPTAQSLRDLVRAGPALYGKEALKSGVPLSPGAELLVQQLEKSTDPLWVCCWGGTNVLAQALQHIHQKHMASEAKEIRSRLRVYTISDQDDTGLWMRVTWPDIFYICSVHGWSQYHSAAWIGISGNIDGGSDMSLVAKEWYSKHIQVGPLGKAYPDHKFIVEGDTPTFLYLIPNGLGSSEHPEWGSWGGRYIPTDRGLAARHYGDATDKAVGKDGRFYSSNYATIWRWREAYQHDFAGRIQWTLTDDFTKANHAPVVSVNGSTGPEPLTVEVEAGSEVVLDASETYDPDGDELTFSWFQYREVTSALLELHDQMVATPELTDLDEKIPHRQIKLKVPPADKCAVDFYSGKPVEKGQELHYILTVKDNGTPAMLTYKRVIVRITNPKLLGGSSKSFTTTTDWLEAHGFI
ncbi:uncharacterized protein E0L32_001252 [Thyridium curvatum]|uniref:DUF1593-domain-containing protein n=1 Tax=Thyridium curvatum TaxID=1093900 RepID=A0A507AIN5_9PEZI|nr:uncharacterized protein E0L32_001252 [Thyridium curvatum]TPX10055.1 hypothetical protein E0L32_001252 [Thyridium curvatum]